MSPLVREFHPRGKAVATFAFAFAVAASGYGVFTTGRLSVFGIHFPPGSVPVLVFLALVAGVVAIRRSLGEERCRRCGCALEPRRLDFSTDATERVATAVETGNAAVLEGTPPGQGVVVELRHCPKCRNVAVLKARTSDGAELTSEHVLVGPDVLGWVTRP